MKFFAPICCLYSRFTIHPTLSSAPAFPCSYLYIKLSKFQKSLVVGSAADQSAAIKETVNTIGLVAALVITITVPIAMNPGDVDFKTNTDLWGSDIQIFDEAATKVFFYACIYFSIAFHIASIGGAILSAASAVTRHSPSESRT